MHSTVLADVLERSDEIFPIKLMKLESIILANNSPAIIAILNIIANVLMKALV